MSASRTAPPIISRLLSRLRLAPLASSRLGILLRVALWGLAAVYFAFALLLLALRYAILPQIESYRGNVEQMLGAAINRPVGIRKIEAHWAGLHPALKLEGFEIRDAENRPALGFEHVEAELSWSSLWHLELRLARLELDSPALQLRRDKAGRLFAAGLEISPQPGDEDGFADWLLLQDRVIIRDASIAWHDELRGAAPLELKHMNLQIDNSGSRHRFGFTAEPPQQLAARLDIRGEFKGRDLDQFKAWKGEVYAELDYADLAGWRNWVDYPVALPQGSGALRLWLGFADKQLSSVTADVRLADVRLQLRPDLPELDLLRLEGRLAGRRLDGGFKAELKHLTLATRNGLAVQPTDVELNWLGAAANRPAQGSASANGLDLAALAQLASHLPLDDATRARLARHAPQGRVFDLKLDWKGSAENPAALASWSLKSRFEGLGLSALGPVPGISGISGRIEGSDKTGSVRLDGHAASLELPNVFADPKLELEALAADISWTGGAKGLLVNMQKISFHNKDAAGEASGSWRPLGEGPGQLDLDARFSRGSGTAVWRYMPLVVGKNVRDWLQAGIKSGNASDVTLKLHGDLSKFPYRGGAGGVFEVRGKFKDAALRYAGSWPEINAINGELLFAGERMLITVNSGKILGVTLKAVSAEIADLQQHNNLLTVTGKAAGPTAEFLRFIEASPVGERIDHFTEEMRAEGSGELDLKLQLPLYQLPDSKVDGNYRFDGNRLIVDKDLPPLTDVRGGLKFSSNHLQASGIRGSLLEMPLSVDVKTAGDGSVQVSASGEVVIATLRRLFPHPIFDRLSGGAKWSSTVRARKNSAEVKLSSNLLGISSSLPAPFNKSATEPMAFSFERKPQPVAATLIANAPRAGARGEATKEAIPGKRVAPPDMLELNLGSSVRLQLHRRHDSVPASITRGTLALGDVRLPMPERELAIAVNLPNVDADFWRKLLASPIKGLEQDKTQLPRLPAIQFDLRAAELAVLDKNFHDVRVKGSRPEKSSNTRFDLKSQELSGNFDWNSAGSGKLSGNIAEFSIPESVATPTVLQEHASEVIDQIPALDITVEKLVFKNRPLGTVRIAAQNLDGVWNTQINAKNEDGKLEASGHWRRSATKSDTDIEFKLDAKSIEKLIARIGYPDTVKRGSAKLTGNLSWGGSPFKIDYPTLDGKLSLDASGGQFIKLEPGVGRLLGILSLQSLPRRITLDFRDIFSQGFAFDSIGGQFTVARGEMETKELQIKGPSAKVLMSGTVNLETETQNLKVRVQPAVGESIAVGAMIANPVAGAVVWVAQKLFKDPLDQAFAFEYGVTGSWADPKVEKLGQSPKAAAEEAK